VLLGEQLFRLAFTPGAAEGVARGDVVRQLESGGAFEVVERSGLVR